MGYSREEVKENIRKYSIYNLLSKSGMTHTEPAEWKQTISVYCGIRSWHNALFNSIPDLKCVFLLAGTYTVSLVLGLRAVDLGLLLTSYSISNQPLIKARSSLIIVSASSVVGTLGSLLPYPAYSTNTPRPQTTTSR